MYELTTYVAIAEIIAAAAIVGGAIFGVIQVIEFRKQRSAQVAADLCRAFTEPEFAKAVVLLSSLPDGLSLKEFKARDSSYQVAAQIVGMMFETMGILVQKKIASFLVVQELAGGLLLMLWRKIEYQIKDTRIEQNNPRFGEWVQWLVERIEEREDEKEPAFIEYAGSKKHHEESNSTEA
ncbi:MAG: hypothetical protein HKN40_06800 [Winogradskyella sp.]|uniref:DUF4760 domain-containing protein n=1 Tax=Winogradskyella sp. TaxID=1883156 RepID=UPI00180A0D9C|nr:hypothetical protein [Winogradskyella sp.]